MQGEFKILLHSKNWRFMLVDIEKLLEQKSKEIDSIIEKWVPKSYDNKTLESMFGKARYSYSANAANKALSEPIWDLLSRGGKRWRPALMMLICEALGGDPAKHKDWVAIPELVHNGTLMVDDVEDGSELRRGKPCVHKTYGVDIAVNAGNAMYYLPLQVMLQSNLPADVLLKAHQIYTQEMINISLGQGMDIAWHKGIADADSISEQEYLQMCAYKTGTLARMAAKLGALLANASDDTIEKMGEFAEAVGVGFQIQDDVLNLTATSGKNHFTKDYIGEDIHEGKRTLIVIHALSKASPADKARLLEILKMHTWDRALIDEAIEMMKKYGAIDYARKRSQEIVQSAWQKAEQLMQKGTAKDTLKAFVEFMVLRQY